MSKAKRAISLFLAIFAFLLFCCSGTLVQTAIAIVGVDDAVIAIIIAALAAIGITFATTGAYSSLEEYVSSLLIDYAEYNGTTVNSLLRGANSGTDKFGRLLINNRFLVVISGFAAWLRSYLSLSNNQTQTLVSPGVTLGNLVAYSLPIQLINRAGVLYEIYAEALVGHNVFVLFQESANEGYYSLVICSDDNNTPIKYTQVLMPEGIITIEATYYTGTEDGNYYTYVTNSYGVNDFPNVANFVHYSSYEINSALGQYDLIEHDSTISVVTGEITIPLDDDQYTEGDGAVIDIDNEWGKSYRDVIGDIEDGFSDSQTLDPTITYEGEEEITEQVEETPAESISQEANDYQVLGLQNVFPFCIPFDIYAFFECLAADPVAPVVNWRFYVPGICDETITLDLSQFDTVAQIVRTMELLAFIVGLALVTREKFLRG